MHREADEAGRVKSRERGASLVEYALLVALIALVCMVAVLYLGAEAREAFSDIGESVGQA